MKRILYIFICILTLTLMFSCRSAKEITKKEENKPINIKPTEPQKPTEDELLLEKVQHLDNDFSTLSCKLSVEYDGINYTGSMRMKRDNTIWISIGKFGIEAARLMLTKDSIFFINKLQSSYFKGGYGFFTSMIGFRVDYSMMQSLLLGESIKQSFSSKASIKRQNEIATITFPDIQIQNSVRRLKEDVIFNTQSNHIEKNFVQVLNTINRLQIDYSNYTPIGSIIIPQTLDVTITQRNITKAQVSMTKHKINEAIEFPFAIPSRYKEMK